MTIQTPDHLLLAGKQFVVRFNSRLPEHHLGIRPATSAERKASGVELTTACWRGYVATWQIKDQRLLLVRLQGSYAKRTAAPIFAQWITDVFQVPMGKEIAVPRGYSETRHEWELHIGVNQGRVTEAALFDFKSACPVHVIAKQGAFEELGIPLRPAYPILKLATLVSELGKVEERTVSPDWWAREFPMHKRPRPIAKT